jgi:glycosyltransferase involved in cell wall biosynthesis
MNWSVIAPFLVSNESPWLFPFIHTDRHRIQTVPFATEFKSWHDKKRGRTGLSEWLSYYRYATRAMEAKPDGIITIFPQLAVGVGLRKRLSHAKLPIIAWSLNLGELYAGHKRSLARFALQSIDRYVVHSRRECDNYSSHFELPRERFEFVPLQHGYIEPSHPEDEDRPFILSMGSAKRDYHTLVEAVRPLSIRTLIVASPRSVEGLSVPDCVEVRSGLSSEECLVLAQRARLIIVPIDNDETASGQVTVVSAMWLRRPVVASRCIGTEDYIDSGVDGCLVPPRDPEELRRSIAMLWEDHELRRRMGRAARERAVAQYSDETAGAALEAILNRFTA